jgi:hypothetical protein
MESPISTLHAIKHNDEVRLYAFDILAMNGDHLRPLVAQSNPRKAFAPAAGEREPMKFIEPRRRVEFERKRPSPHQRRVGAISCA